MASSLEDKLNLILEDKNTNLLPENLKQGVTCLGVEGTMQAGIDTSDATATVNDIAQDKTAYVNGEKITGTLPLFPNSRTFIVSNAGVANNTEDSTLDLTTINTTKQILDSNVSMNFNAAYSDVATAIGLTAEKLVAGETILGVEGTYEGEGGDDVSNYINMTPTETSLNIRSLITKVPEIDTSNVTNMMQAFQNCRSLVTIPQLDTHNVTNMSEMFASCTSLTTVPELNMSSVTNITNMFDNCSNLSDDSLNNILASLLTATSYTSTKTLKHIGLSEEQATKCTTLGNYEAFTAAGWTTGY